MGISVVLGDYAITYNKLKKKGIYWVLFMMTLNQEDFIKWCQHLIKKSPVEYTELMKGVSRRWLIVGFVGIFWGSSLTPLSSSYSIHLSSFCLWEAEKELRTEGKRQGYLL